MTLIILEKSTPQYRAGIFFLGDQFLEVPLPQLVNPRKLIEFSEHLSRLYNEVLVLKTVNTIKLNFLGP